MIKWKSKYFKDLKPFDTFSFESLLERTEKTLKDISPQLYDDQVTSGQALLGIRSDNLNDPDVKYFHEKYNHPSVKIPTDSQIVLRQFDPPYDRPEYHEEDNLYIFDSITSNVNNRDGFIVGGLSTKKVEDIHINPVREKRFTGEWIYLEFPYKFVYENMLKSINNAPLFTAKKFVEEIEKNELWNNDHALGLLVEKYNKKRPNWNHDFPIKSFIQVHNEGIIFPCQWFDPSIVASEGTHKMVMCGFNKMDIPFIIPVPNFSEHTKFWHVQTSTPIFYNFKVKKYQYISGVIDLNNKTIEWKFSTERFEAENKNKELYKKWIKELI